MLVSLPGIRYSKASQVGVVGKPDAARLAHKPICPFASTKGSESGADSNKDDKHQPVALTIANC